MAGSDYRNVGANRMDLPHGEDAMTTQTTGWQPIETAPTDGTKFLVLIGGIPYMGKMQDGRFIWYMHTNIGNGPTYLVHNVNGREMLEKIEEGRANFVPNGVIWRDGLSDLPTHWMHLAQIPDDARRTPTAQELIRDIAKHPTAIRKEGNGRSA